jgi:hypothetical protein
VDTPFYRSFLVRLWRDPPEASGAWRGEVESIQGGQLVTVQSLDEALECLRNAAENSQPPAPPAPKTDHQLADDQPQRTRG